MLNNSPLAPVLSFDEVVSAVEGFRSNGEKIILANGCFDLFHVGHLRYLVGAKQIGGILLVALNSDRQTRLLKGNGRPFVVETERAELVSGLRCVDLVTIFDDPTVEQVVRAVRPDFHAKGTDYTAESVPEREIVREYGGRVAIVGDPKDHSSTELIASVRGLTLE
jgi:rfaE bifunctional protein nucleotidyltransferase chain/domain